MTYLCQAPKSTCLDLFFCGKKILVTGSSGFIAHTLIEKLSKFSCTVFAATSCPDLRFPHLQSDHPADIKILDSRRLQTEDPSSLTPFDFDILFHLSAQTHLESGMRDPGNDFLANVMSLIDILSRLKPSEKVPRVIFASTVTISGISQRLPVNEAAPEFPTTFYCFHKKLAEGYLEDFANAGKVLGASLRLPNVYGPGPGSKNPDRGFLNRMIKNALKGETLEIFGEGSEIRDFIYIDDTVDAFLRAAAHCELLCGRPYVIGTAQGHTFLEAAELIAAAAHNRTGLRPLITHTKPHKSFAINRRNFIADPSLFCSLTGWKSTTDLSCGILRTMELSQ